MVFTFKGISDATACTVLLFISLFLFCKVYVNGKHSYLLDCYALFLILSSYAWLQQRQPSKTDDASKAKLSEVAKRLESAMWRTATSKVPPVLIFSLLLFVIYIFLAKYYLGSFSVAQVVIVLDGNFFWQEDYLDFRSFDVRVESTLKQLLSQRRANPSSSVSTMVQTPGVSHGWGQSYTATPMVDTSKFNSSNNLSDATTETGRLLPTNRMYRGNYQSDLMLDSIV
jgi:E1A/CREB-binding protein